MEQYMPGDRVQLNTGATAKVIEVDPCIPDRYRLAAVHRHNVGCVWDGNWVYASAVLKRTTPNPAYPT